MMRIDRERGCLRIDGRSLTGLLARLDDQVQGLVSSEAARWFDTDEARAAGVLDGTRFTPELSPLADTIAAPWGELALSVAHGGLDDEHRLWLGPRTAVAALSSGDGHYDLGGLAPTAVPALVWRTAQLGARDRDPAATGPVAVDEDCLRALVESGDARPLAQAMGRTGASTALKERRWRLVTIHIEWAAALNSGTPWAQALCVLDTPAGVLQLELDDDGACLAQPTTPADLWPRLVAMTRPPSTLDLDGSYARATSADLGLRLD